MLDDNFIGQMKEKLQAEKERVEKKIDELTTPEDREANPDWDDTANDAIEDVEQESLLRIYLGLQERVIIALKKIEDGSYGYCKECNTWIPEKVLQLEPWAEYCGAVCRQKNQAD